MPPLLRRDLHGARTGLCRGPVGGAVITCTVLAGALQFLQCPKLQGAKTRFLLSRQGLFLDAHIHGGSRYFQAWAVRATSKSISFSSHKQEGGGDSAPGLCVQSPPWLSTHGASGVPCLTPLSGTLSRESGCACGAGALRNGARTLPL